MKINYPHTIKNPQGEQLTFHRMEMEGGEEKLIIENYVPPFAAPIMHTFLKQDECLIVLHGKLGYQIEGQEPKFAHVGESVLFKRGTPHRFWNAGEEELNCFGWIKPAYNIVFYLTALYGSLDKNGIPEQYDAAYLLHRYRREFDLPEMPRFVKSVVLPTTYGIGVLTGRYRKFKNAPEPVDL